MPKPCLSGSFHFGDEFELNIPAYELRSRGTPLRLKPNAMELLLLLVERRGQLVTREEIVERIWGKNVFVDSDNSINSAISRIRQALRDDTSRPRFIQTVSGKGYRFIAAVSSGTPNSVPHLANPMHPQPACILGREGEIKDICAELRRPDVRLLTLLGVGGVGKTSLAKAVAGVLRPEFVDGVFFVDLTDIRRPELVSFTIEQVLGIRSAEPNPDALKEYLIPRKLLLVLDNFEQVLPAANGIAELLAVAANLKIVVTSRALLRLRDEHEYIVPPLVTPDAPEECTFTELSRYGAVRLFAERAKAVRPTFELTRENAPTVAQICARVEGLPLAIELAAARIKLLSPQSILSRLDHRLKLLSGGLRDIPGRQQTMSAAIEWSYDLLNQDEQRLFRSLSVFAGGFTVEAAENVLQDKDVIERTTSLVNQSLLAVRETGAAAPRLYMLEVVREFAFERLESSCEGRSVRKAHAACFMSVAEEAEPHLQGAQPAPWLHRLDLECDNIRAALSWSVVNEIETAARIAAAIRYFWLFRGYLTEALNVLTEILSAAESVPRAVRCKLLSTAGNIAKFQGDYGFARAMYEQGLSEGRTIGDLSQVSLFCRGLGGLSMEQGDHSSALVFAQQALTAAREADDEFGVARSINLQADLARATGDDKFACPLYEEALQICRRLGNTYGVSNILTNLAAAEYGLGDYASARAHFVESLGMCVTPGGSIVGDTITISYALDGFAALAIEEGAADFAATLAGAADRLRESMNYNIEPAERRFRAGYMAQVQKSLTNEELSNMYGLGRTLKLQRSVALALGTQSGYADSQ
ncbi:MAG: winged helix-turn-helix domain-containing protein [Terriglobia bacterium]|nr:winged helix-turn-helix domain-containing protein [Terriglobia bacterium]